MIEETYDAYVEKVYTFFYIQCFDRAVAEDLTSQTFMLFVEKAQGVEIADGKKYVYGIMRNVWLQYLRDKYKRQESSIEDIDDMSAYVDAALEVFEDETPSGRAEHYVKLLPQKQQEVVAMRLFVGMSTSDVAKTLGKDRNYVKTTYKRGIKRLRQLLDEHPFTDAVEQERSML